MFRTVFSKMFTVYISILLGSLLFIGIVFSNVFKSYFINYTEKVMVKQAEQIVLEYEKAAITGVIDVNQINFELKVLDKYLDASTWIVDKEGKIIIVSGEENMAHIGQSIFHKALQKVYQKEIVRIESGFEQYFKEPVLSIGYPMVLNGNVERALFIHTPMPEVLQIVQEVKFIFIRVLSLSSLVAFLCTYILSLYITMPLKEMNQAAKLIAGGDFGRRIELEERSDEIGELAYNFNYMAHELDKIEEMRKLFIENISHDLRTPLTSVKGFVQAIMDGTIPPEQQNKYLQIVLDEAERMNKMTNDILALTKVDNNEVNINKEPFELNRLIKEILVHFEPISLEQQNRVEVILSEGETWVCADRELMIRVLHNLLENAFKFVEDKGLIVVETTYNANKVNVSISNSGMFIPPEDINHIWDRFHKVDKSRGKDKVGTGLGLAIVKGIIKNHNEQIWVTSKQEELTTFTFTVSKSTKRV
ncbi:MAG TPA: cell wall metabolism sensor histidine kinase WalK [Epulopiscium sp.]|nr:cell wall metabolism sensor histidine kinase WalK [Candidatus Epulonipiscium sp.]